MPRGPAWIGSPDKAHGNTDDRGGSRLSLVKHFEQPEQGSRRVTDGDDGAFQMRPPKLQRRGRSGVSDFGSELRHARIVQRTDDAVVCWQPAAGDAMCDHLRVTQDGSAVQQCVGRARGKGRGHHGVVGDIDHPAGVDHPDDDLFLPLPKAGEIGLGADDLK